MFYNFVAMHVHRSRTRLKIKIPVELVFSHQNYLTLFIERKIQRTGFCVTHIEFIITE